MEKQTINVPDTEEFARTRTRRDFFKSLAVVGAGAGAGSILLSKAAFGQAPTMVPTTDAEIANFALAIEYLEANVLYPAGLESGLLSAEARDVVAQLVDIEAQHRDGLIAIIPELGGTPIEMPQFTLPDEIFQSEETFLQASLLRESSDVGFLLANGPRIQNRKFLAAGASFSGAEGQNVVALKNLLGVVPPASEAFPAALTEDEILTTLAPYLGMGSMMDTGGPSSNG